MGLRERKKGVDRVGVVCEEEGVVTGGMCSLGTLPWRRL